MLGLVVSFVLLGAEVAAGRVGTGTVGDGGHLALTPVTLAPVLTAIGFTQGVMVMALLGATLAGVPAERAGVASGAFTTTQQMAISLRVAGIGSLFFTIAQRHGYGVATVTVEFVQAALTLIAVVFSIRLSRRR